MEMSCDTDVSYGFGIFHEVFEIRCGVISLKGFMKVVLFGLDFGNNWCFEGLSVFLLNHDFSLGVHLLMGLVILFILMKDDSVFIGGVDNLYVFTQLRLLWAILLF